MKNYSMKKKEPIPIFEKQIKKFVESRRPPEELREKVDLQYTFDPQTMTVEIFHLRSNFLRPEEKVKSPIVKAKFVKSRNIWKVYWMRASGKWEGYEPAPEVATLRAFIEVVDADEWGCFWG